jgi:hypothetical protein
METFRRTFKTTSYPARNMLSNSSSALFRRSRRAGIDGADCGVVPSEDEESQFHSSRKEGNAQCPRKPSYTILWNWRWRVSAKRRVARIITVVCVFILLLCFIIIAERRVVVFGTLDLSPVVYHVARRTGLCVWQHEFAFLPASSLVSSCKCKFDFCTVTHEGGEGTLYRGKCCNSSDGTGDPGEMQRSVLFKSTKISNRRSAWTEADATRTFTATNKSDLLLLDSGLNYLILTELAEYEFLNVRKLMNAREMDFSTVLVLLLKQVGAQLVELHRAGYLHLDVSRLNILQHSYDQSQAAATKTTFQLIDLSGAQPMHQWRRIIHGMYYDMKRFHLPKLPDLACLVADDPDARDFSAQQEYCRVRRIEGSSARLCPGLVDLYPLGILGLDLVLRFLGEESIAKRPTTSFPLSNNTTQGFAWIVEQRQAHVAAWHRLDQRLVQPPMGSYRKALRLIGDVMLISAPTNETANEFAASSCNFSTLPG